MNLFFIIYNLNLLSDKIKREFFLLLPLCQYFYKVESYFESNETFAEKAKGELHENEF